jgi:hypothetical protein
MIRLALMVAVYGALIPQAQAGGISRYEGWWVVLGSFADPDLRSGHQDDIRKLRRQAARCGVSAIDDFSQKFIGFAPGYDVVASGAYSRDRAQSVLLRVRPCVPEAYIKYGRYAGE